jgi:predicted O-methyltransferase YrrM
MSLARAQFDRLVAPIEGWLGLDEGWALHQSARATLERNHRPVAVEIGSWKGRSTAAIAIAFAAVGRGVLYAVDPHANTGSHARAGESDTLAALERTLAAVGVQDHVRVIRATSASARAKVPPNSVHFLFIDGSHRYEDVVRDMRDWQAQLAPRATVAFHDAVTGKDVRRAISRHVLRKGTGYDAPRLVGNTLFTVWLGRDGSVRPGWPIALSTRLRIARSRVKANIAALLATRQS